MDVDDCVALVLVPHEKHRSILNAAASAQCDPSRWFQTHYQLSDRDSDATFAVNVCSVMDEGDQSVAMVSVE
jgi:hypothetical protein